MKTYITAYLAAFVVMLLIDGVWLTTMAKSFYGKHLGHLMSTTPSLLPAGIFYFIYILGLTVLVVLPALSGNYSLVKILLLGGLFGLVAYGTYDLTNQATLKDWPVIVTIVDLIWGTLLTGVVSVITVFIVRMTS